MAGTTPKNCPSLGGSALPSNTWFRGPTGVFIQNGMSIGSAVFAHRTVERPIGRHVSPPPKKMSLSFGGSGPPSNTWYLWPTRIIKPNGISISSAVSVLVPNGMLYNALLMGKETPNIAPSHWDCVISPEEDRVTVIGNMRQKCGIDRACGSGDMLAHTYTNTHTHTHTHTHTQTCSLQYFATAPAGDQAK